VGNAEDGQDEPWADPQIQIDYERALGQFLVRFNKVENLISDIIPQALMNTGSEHLLAHVKGDLFARKLITLELALDKALRTGSRRLFDELRELNSRRNDLAHGHFDQNPVDGDYVIVTSKKTRDVPITLIQRLADRVEKAWHELRHLEATFMFADVATVEASEVRNY
jgi:hypothetical protein